MKKVLFSLASLIIVCCYANSSSAQEASKEGAKIEFKKEVHDYGSLKYGSDGRCSFEFKNTGTVPLIILKAKGTCGCTVPSWPKEPIAPGETGEIIVKYDTQRPGEINKSVTITSNAVNFPTKLIGIKGTVSPKPGELTKSPVELKPLDK